MKKFGLSIIAVCCMALMSCLDDNLPGGMAFGVPSRPSVQEVISSSVTNLSFSADGGTESVTITSNFDWETINKPSWVTLTPSTGSNGSVSLSITAGANTDTSSRTGTITLGNSSKSVTISVSQDAPVVTEISANVTSLTFSANGGSESVTITSNFVWEMITKPEWITISPSSGASGSTTLTITAEKSTSSSTRTGIISLGNSSKSVTISVSQSVAESISSSPSSLSFSAEGGTRRVWIASNFKWETIDKPSWISISPSNSSLALAAVSITAEESSSTSSRSGTIKLGNSSTTVSISVTQSAADAISASVSSLSFSADGGTESITITSNFDWGTVDKPSWITLTPSSGSSGNTSLTVRASASTSSSPRSGTIKLGNSNTTVSISVTQSAADAISASVSSLSFTADGGSESITITSNFGWSTIDKPSWITLTPSSGSSGTKSLTVRASASTISSSRSGTIKLGNSNATVSISVSQSALEKISANRSSLSFSSGGESKVLSVTSNFSWEIINNPWWVTISPSNGGSDETTSLIVTADESISTTSRTGTITLGRSSSMSISISISQAVAQKISSETFTVNGVSFKMMKVEGGTLDMKSSVHAPLYHSNPEDETITAFYIGETEVTQELWTAVMGYTPGVYFIDPKRPVHTVTWDDCRSFITKLNSLTGRNFRLPSRNEWLFAAIGGNNSKGYKYSGSNDADEIAWYSGNVKSGGWPDEGPHYVATKKANELGLYDMSGNVDEIVDENDDRGYFLCIGGNTNHSLTQTNIFSVDNRIWTKSRSCYTGFRIAL